MSAAVPQIVTLGETMALFRPSTVGPAEQVDAYLLSTGGAESNVAIGAVRLGLRAVWIGRVGDDPLGRRVLRDLRAEGVVTHAILDPAATTGVMVKETRIAGRTSVTYARTQSAGSRLSPEDIDATVVGGADLLHVTGITPALSESAEAAVFAAIRTARAAGVPVSFDVNDRRTLWGDRDPRDLYRRLAAESDILFAGDDEAELIVGSGSADRLAARLAELGPSSVVIKRGAAGAYARSRGEILDCAALAIEAVDTVGAGDAFVAGYLAEHLRGADLRHRLATAVRCGAFACLGPGDWESFPRTHELDLLDRRDPVQR